MPGLGYHVLDRLIDSPLLFESVFASCLYGILLLTFSKKSRRYGVLFVKSVRNIQGRRDFEIENLPDSEVLE